VFLIPFEAFIITGVEPFYFKILDNHHSEVFADGGGSLAKKTLTAISVFLMLSGQFPLGLGVISAGLPFMFFSRHPFSSQGFLESAEFALVTAETVKRFYNLTVGQCGEPNHT
jgi:hypothetical protein